jgi:hypothetical protein
VHRPPVRGNTTTARYFLIDSQNGAIALSEDKELVLKILLRILSVLFVAIGALLIWAVINALGSAGGAKPAVAVAYVVGSIVLGFVAVWMWRRPGRTTTPTPDASV